MAKNPTIKDCTLDMALGYAKRKEEELPQIIQVYPTDWAVVVLANEVKRLRRIIDDASYEKDNPK